VNKPDIVHSGSLIEPEPDKVFFGRQELDFPMAR